MKKTLLFLTLLAIGTSSFGQRFNPRFRKDAADKDLQVQPKKEVENADENINQAKPLVKETIVEIPSFNKGKLLQVGVPSTPKSYSLFGEKIPLDMWDVRERLDREILVNTFMQSSTCYIIKLMNRWMPMIEARLAANGVPDDFKYLAIAESALQNQTSRVGAVGFWQFMPATAPAYGLYIDGEVDERYNPEAATDAACKYLKQAYNKFGNWTSAAASYNCGMGGMNNALTSQGETSFYDVLLPEETMRYVFRIAALKYILSNPQNSGFNLGYEDVYKPLKVRRETISGGLGNLIDYAKRKGTNYKTIRLLNPWIRDKNFSNSKGRTYTVFLPSE